MWLSKPFNLTKFTKLKFTANWAYVYLATPEDSSGTTTLRLQATRSRSVAISLLGALLCIWRTPSICPLRLNPIFGGEWTSEVELTDPKMSRSDSCTQMEILRATIKKKNSKEKRIKYLIWLNILVQKKANIKLTISAFLITSKMHTEICIGLQYSIKRYMYYKYIYIEREKRSRCIKWKIEWKLFTQVKQISNWFTAV